MLLQYIYYCLNYKVFTIADILLENFKKTSMLNIFRGYYVVTLWHNYV